VRRTAPGLQDLLALGAVCGVMIGLGVFLGYLVDRWLATAPLVTFVGLAIGILGAATGSYRVIRPYLSDARTGAPEMPNASTGAPDTKD
jgi:F0F1-type ATP synthase assembly protein I